MNRIGNSTGKAMALLAAAAYGVNTTLSRLAYDTGTTPVSLTVYRYIMIAGIMVVLMLILRKSWRLCVPPSLFFCCVLGMYLISIGHLGAVRYVPVSLAAIVFYTFPLQVIAYRRLVSREPVTRFETIGFLLAFSGLVIALGPQFHQVNWLGLAMALSGAFGAALFLICYESFPPDTDSVTATTWITLGTVTLCIATLLLGFELTPPVETKGWLYLSLIAVFSVVAFLFTLASVKKIGAAAVALFLNLEPVIIHNRNLPGRSRTLYQQLQERTA